MRRKRNSFFFQPTNVDMMFFGMDLSTPLLRSLHERGQEGVLLPPLEASKLHHLPLPPSLAHPYVHHLDLVSISHGSYLAKVPSAMQKEGSGLVMAIPAEYQSQVALSAWCRVLKNLTSSTHCLQ